MSTPILASRPITKMLKQFKASNCDVIPPWYRLRTLQQEMTPELFPLVQLHVGVYFPLYSAIKITAKQIFNCVTNVPSSDSEYILTIKFGFDGSGVHSIFHQAGNVETNNMILAMFLSRYSSQQHVVTVV